MHQVTPDQRISRLERRLAREKERVRQLEIMAENRSRELYEQMEKYRKAKDALAEAEKLSGLGQIAGGLGHELNNPLNYAVGNARFIRKYFHEVLRVIEVYEENLNTEASARAAVAQIKEEVDWDFLIEDFKDISVATEDGIQRALNIVHNLRLFMRDHVCLERVEHQKICKAAVEITQSELRNKEIRVIQNYVDLPPIRCSPTAMEQVLANLISNAGAAIEKNGEIRIHSTQDRSKCRITVEDTGQGIPPENIARLFEPFFTTKPPGKGLGLGLALCRTIMLRQRGEIRFQSTVGKGTTAIV